jgi:hypothetical protein
MGALAERVYLPDHAHARDLQFLCDAMMLMTAYYLD